MLKRFIERPVLSTVISIIILVLGFIGLISLPVSQYPEIAPPTVRVSANYTGANAEAVMNSVIIPLEEQINGVEGMAYMQSNAANDGSGSIAIVFNQGVDPDMAVVNVQALVSRASPLLPAEVTRSGVQVSKQQSSNVMMVSFTSDHPDYDAKFVQNYVNINILPQIKRVRGVGDANTYGAKDYSMRVWMKPDLMAIYKISPMEVIAALQDQNVEAAPGALGANSNQSFEYSLKYTGRLKTSEEFGNIILRSVDGQVLKLKDVADVELDAVFYSVITRLDGKDALTVAISQTAGSNAQKLISDIKAVLEEARKTFPPGLDFIYMMDANEFLEASISKLMTTFLEAFLLVFLVVFIFLQDFKSTIIPAIAIPVSIIGTFFFLLLFGFTINILTLFALVLAIGIVVDDAIIVVEAVHAQMEAGEKDPKKATIKAMNAIAPAIISVTLVMAAVFVPVSFIGGTSGVFFKQFGLTLAIAILISAVNALSLSPSLCALLLKPHDETKEKKKFLSGFYAWFNRGFATITRKYKGTVYFLGKKKNQWMTIAMILGAVVVMLLIMKKLPSGFVPNEDGGVIMAMVSLPPGSSLERTDEVNREIDQIVSSLDEVNHITNIIGVSFTAQALGSSYSSIIIKLKHWNERDKSADEVTAILKEKSAHIQDATIAYIPAPTLQGFGLSSGVELKLQDRTGGDLLEFNELRKKFVSDLQSNDKVMMVLSEFNPSFPQYLLEADIPKIKDAGLQLSDVTMTLQAYIGSMYVSDFNLYGKQFRVMLQAPPEYRSKLDDLNKIMIRTPSGEMAPVTEFIHITPQTAPLNITRFNMYSSMDITIIPNIPDGYSTGDVIELVGELGAEFPLGYGFEYSGLTKEETDSSNEIGIIFALCLTFVYLLLAALYESYILPFAVLLSLPMGLAGVFIFIFIALMFGSGIVNNIYVQVSLVMLIGLLSKNAILIVEYAVQRREEGHTIADAAVRGAVARFRPILMTSFAFIFGVMPLMFASGAGAVGNRSIGISAVGGMFIGTMFGVIVIPSLYVMLQTLQERISKPKTVTK